MSDVNAYIFFNGNCADAMKFYESALGGSLRMVKASDTPGGSGDAIMHAHLGLASGGALLASDWMDDKNPYPGMHGFRVYLGCPTVADAQRAYDALAAGAKSVEMPFGKTFWSDGFGMLTDKFGTGWMVGAEEKEQG